MLQEYSETLAERVARMNAQGAQDPVCPVCRDKGMIYVGHEESLMVRRCECRLRERARRQAEKSGLRGKLRDCTMESFCVRAPWQARMKQAAERFLVEAGGGMASGGTGAPRRQTEDRETAGREHADGNSELPPAAWFYLGGQPGSGKTHLCTAILNAMLAEERAVRYMVWPTEADSIKANADGYVRALEKLCEVPVLYIDDFLRVPRAQGAGAQGGWAAGPSAGDINAAFKLVNHRYLDERRVTIFSSEHTLEELARIDAGLAGRIFERCRGYRLEIARDGEKDLRRGPVRAEPGL